MSCGTSPSLQQRQRDDDSFVMCFLLAMATQKIYIKEIDRSFYLAGNGNHFGPLTESGGLDGESLDGRVAHLPF